MKQKIFVITVNYNNGNLTSDCLKSFAVLDTTGIDINLVVVDNDSTEEASQLLEKKTKNVKFLYSKINLGFAGGNNIGINYALKNNADYVLLINNDATVEDKDFFQKMLDTKGDIVSPLVKYRHEGKLTYDYGGKVDYLFGRNTHINKKSDYSPDYYSGVCLLIKTSVFKEVGGLDDGFFLYYEDTDFCLKAKKLGFSLKFCPSVSIFHHLSMSANKLGKKKLIILANSHLRFCSCHLPIVSAPLYLSFNLYLRLKTLFL